MTNRRPIRFGVWSGLALRVPRDLSLRQLALENNAGVRPNEILLTMIRNAVGTLTGPSVVAARRSLTED